MKNQKETIRRMVSYLNNEEKDGGFWLPNIQRSFVWKEEQIERLFDSIMREYPISTLLIWRTKSEIRHRKFIDNYRHTLKLTDFYVPEDGKTKLLVLDGQQRLQSLFIGLKGSYEKKELYFNVLSGNLVAPEDVRYHFKFIDSQVASFPWVKFKDIVFSNKLYNQIANSIVNSADITLSTDKINKISDNIARAIQQFCNDETIVYQELDSVDNPDIYNDDDVVEIFIRANAGGTRLGKSDLLFSLLISTWEDADEQIEELLDSLNRSGYDFSRDFVLKTCLSLLGKGARYEVSKFRDGTTREEIIAKWGKISDAIKDVKDFLYGKTFLRSDRALPSYLTFIPIIYFRYHYPHKWNTIQQLDTYILRTLLTGAFSGTPDNLIDKCTRAISDSSEFSVNRLFDIIRADGRSLEITKDTILGQYYGSKDIHLIFNLWYKDFDYVPSYENNLPQIDHIFPQSLLRSIKDVNPTTGKRNILKYKWEDRDQIANCMLLTTQENGAGGKWDIPPTEWFEDKPANYLEMHLIPKDKELWRLENYEQFIEARKCLILEKFGYLIQTSSQL
ncbi:MAG: DUF262 domain-containing protein [Anaerolineae bacterium]|nr:DUF262 domain-containing protein [Anaerolineae bacterium]